jgi:hypothetical protein
MHADARATVRTRARGKKKKEFMQERRERERARELNKSTLIVPLNKYNVNISHYFSHVFVTYTKIS